MRFLISAGEASGETYGAQLIDALRRAAPGATFFGLGSDRMRSAGFDAIVDAKTVSVVGLAEVVSQLPRIYREFHRLLQAVDRQRPNAAILIDFPDFNFRLARQLHRRGIPVFYFVSPQIWAWRQGRVELVREYIRKMLVIFPFEQEFYRARGVEVEYVGHPLADLPVPAVTRENFARQNGLHPECTWIALLPGSRRKEIAMNLPTMLGAADALTRNEHSLEFVLPVAPTVDETYIRPLLRQHGALKVALAKNAARPALAHARAAVVASGTATVEAALIGTPFVLVYRVSPVTWLLGRPLVKVPHYGMVNLIAGREIVPELVQDKFTAQSVVAELSKIIPEGAPRTTMLSALAEVRTKLHPYADRPESAADRAAHAILRGLA